MRLYFLKSPLPAVHKILELRKKLLKKLLKFDLAKHFIILMCPDSSNSNKYSLLDIEEEEEEEQINPWDIFFEQQYDPHNHILRIDEESFNNFADELEIDNIEHALPTILANITAAAQPTDGIAIVLDGQTTEFTNFILCELEDYNNQQTQETSKIVGLTLRNAVLDVDSRDIVLDLVNSGILRSLALQNFQSNDDRTAFIIDVINANSENLASLSITHNSLSQLNGINIAHSLMNNNNLTDLEVIDNADDEHQNNFGEAVTYQITQYLNLNRGLPSEHPESPVADRGGKKFRFH